MTPRNVDPTPVTEPDDVRQSLCADINRFGLHVAVRRGANEHHALEQRRRDIAHPALANQ